MKKLLTNNLAAKIASLVLAALLWNVIKRSQLSDPSSQPAPSQPQTVEFGAAAYGK